MWRMSNALLSIRLYAGANRIIYYARKLPLVGRMVPERLYGEGEAKKAFVALAWIAIAFWTVAGKLLYAGLLVALPAAAWPGADSAAERLRMFHHVFWWLSFVAAGVSMATALEPKKEKWFAVKLMRMAPAAYMRTHFAWKYTLFFAGYVPVLCGLIFLLGGGVLHGLLLAAAVTGWRLLCEYAHLRLFAGTGKIVIRDNALVWLTIGASCALAYLPFVFDGLPTAGGLLAGWPVPLALAAAGAAAAFGLARYPGYRAAVDAAARRDDPLLDMTRAMQEAQRKSLENDDAAYDAVRDAGEPAAGARLGSGHVYLQRLFFARHRKFLIRPVWRRVALAAGLAAIGLLVPALAERFPEAARVLKADFLIPYLPIAMSLFAIGEPVCRAMFYHCDSKLMHYGFYRRAAGVHFRLRLLRLAGLNLAAGAALLLALAAVLAAAGGLAAADLLPLGGTVLSLAVFFAVHHLAMYYLLQPYTTELNVRNPFYMLVSTGTTMVCWLCAFFVPAGAVATAAPLAAGAYAAVALVLVRRLGHRTFRVK